jgi:gliding motility-associated-like protein
LGVKKIFCLYLLLACFFSNARADHITGGEMFYTYTGVSGGQYRYHITLKIFMVCNTTRQFNDPTYVSVFNRVSGSRITDISVPLARTELLQLHNQNPCITNPPDVCYRLGYYEFDVTLPASADGYILSSQVIYRVEGMNNLVQGYSNVGATYTAEIPGTASSSSAPANNSAGFTGDDLVIVCANNSISYSFAATDKDGDKLRYSFCSAYQSGNVGFGNNIVPPGSPPYLYVPYSSSYSGSIPLGNNVKIDANTGLITGIAPDAGIYVVTICVEEIRNGVVIAAQRKDLQINITSCTIAAATIPPVYMLCNDTKTINVSNLSGSTLIQSYNWEFFNAAGASIFSSTNQTANYTFPDTGTYKIKLVINKTGQCTDSATTEAKVYPGFDPGFSYDGICINKPTQFTDSTKTIYGQVDSWDWDFDDNTTTTDFSYMQNPVYTYAGEGAKNVRLIVTNTKGCIDTVFNNITITDKPPIALAFRDTLICVNDKVQLNAGGSGIFNWSPNINITNANTPAPTVSPPATTTYYVDLDEDGCLNRDSVLINVVDHVTLQAMNDTTICRGDAIQLYIVSDGLKYLWTPASQLNDQNAQNPTAVTNANTSYQVIAIIGSCTAKKNINVTTVPYPFARAGSDTIICYETFAQLHGITDGSSFTWSPQTALQNSNTLNPIAAPFATIAYTLAAYDTKGCPKPGIDTVMVTVLPDLHAFAGRDTSVVINQPLQLNATGGTGFKWSPPTGLSDINIPNPVAIFNNESSGGIQYKVLANNEAGCVDSAFITVKVFKTLPSVFVPTAFTPNGDGRNDVLKPIAAGMQRVEFFSIYNRWGQLVFSTAINGKGWDGTASGMPQGSGVFVWIVKAIDYTGTPYFQKGTVTLIR